MFSFKNLSITRKLKLIVMLTCMTAIVGGSIVRMGLTYVNYCRDLVGDLTGLAAMIGQNTSVALAFNIPEDGEKALSSLSQKKSIRYAGLFDASGKLFASYSKGARKNLPIPKALAMGGYQYDSHFLHLVFPVMVRGQQIGTLYLLDDVSSVSGLIRRDILIDVLLILGALSIAFIVASRLQSLITRPVLSLARTAEFVSRHKDYSIRASKEHSDEVGILIEAFNEMLSQIQQNAESLKESEGRFRTLIEAAPVAIAIVRNSKFVYVNSSYATMHGFAFSDELVGQSILDRIAPEGLENFSECVRRREHGITVAESFEGTALRKDGIHFSVLAAVVWVHLADGPATLCYFQDITDLKRAEEALARNELELLAIHEHTPVIQCLIDKDTRILRANRAMADFAGRPQQDLIGVMSGEALGCTHALGDLRGCGFGPHCATCAFRQSVNNVLETGMPVRRLEIHPKLVRGDTTSDAIMLLSCSVIEGLGRSIFLLLLEDITGQRRLEEEFRQAQKMEAIGQLAGGVAHDFNNILAAIMMNLGLLEMKPLLDHETRRGLRDLQIEAERASKLTHQLLMFSRRSVMDRRTLDLNEIVANLLKMLARLVGENIKLLFERSHDVAFVEADAGMLEQVLMNLVVNARDSMPKGGRIMIATEVVMIDPAQTKAYPSRRSGRFVCLSVSDTGYGMNAATIERIFEPFFTTKEQGKGTGLGLATVDGIVSQHHGWVEVDSQLGNGASFRVYLPVSDKMPVETGIIETEVIPTGKETIMLVEDEIAVRRLIAQTLRTWGYRVLEAANGQLALTLWRECAGNIDLLFTDMVMPEGMTGLELAEKLRSDKPNLKVIISSGYSTEIAETSRITAAGITYLAKPYHLPLLGKTIRHCLDK
jgi:PAS domain S-box-containing protein